MGRRRPGHRRTAREWVLRGLLAAAVAVVGSVSVTRTQAWVIGDHDVIRAASLAPEDARLTGLRAWTLSAGQASAADRSRADDLARLALRKDATTVDAAATLGFNAQVRGDTGAARRLFAYAETLSRHNLVTQLWSIEDAVGRGDVASALRHYDIVLRTSRSGPELLFPILGTAISDPMIREGLVAKLKEGPSWSAFFIEYVAMNGSDPGATAILFRSLIRNGIPVAPLSNTLLINTLASRGDFAGAWSYYTFVRHVTQASSSRNSDFSVDIPNPTVFDWVPVNADGIVASIEHGDGGFADFSAPASVGGIMLKQMQMLPPGSYVLEGKSAGIDQPESSRPYWILSCGDGREIGRLIMPNSAQADGVFRGRLEVPAGCPVQTLAFVARPSESVSGLSGQLLSAAVHQSR